jgi:hypothetical protein
LTDETKAFISGLTEKPTLVRNGKDLSDQFDYRYKVADDGSASAYFIKLRQSLFSYGCQRVRRQIERRRPGPRALDRDILEMIFDQFADAWRAVDMRNDLEQEVRRRE